MPLVITDACGRRWERREIIVTDETNIRFNLASYPYCPTLIPVMNAVYVPSPEDTFRITDNEPMPSMP